ncbi:MAG: hypothetical protein JW910_13190, partial [Anaerolineae bacterium]|nr:hypothetical protein [Anaerolineae bacterium]
GLKVLLVDADTQFGDVGVFLNLKSQTTLSDLVTAVDDLDMELVENVLATHDSGLRVLLAPDPVPDNLTHIFDPDAIKAVIEKIAAAYDIIIVDTSSRIDPLNAALFDIASKIMLVCPPTLAGVKNVRAVLKLFDESDYPPDKSLLVVNHAIEDRGRGGGGRVTIDTALIEKNLKLTAMAVIPMEERVVLHAINRGVPVIAISKDRNRSPIKELLDLAEAVRHLLLGEDDEVVDEDDEKKDTGGLGWFRRL